MIGHAANSAADQPTDSNRDREDDFFGPPVTAEEVALLQKMVQIGANLACRAAARAEAKLVQADAEAADSAAAKAAEQAANRETKTCEHMSRMMRLTLGLKAKLVMDLYTWRRRTAEGAAEQAKDAEKQRRNGLKQQVGPILEQLVGKDHGGKAAASVAQPMNQWFAERDYETRLPNLPLGEVIGRIAGALGYKIDWSGSQDQPWAADAEASCPPEPGEPTITKIEHVIVYPEWREKQLREAAEAAAAAAEQTATAAPEAPPAEPADASTPQGPPPDEPAKRTGWAAWADP